LGAGYRDEPAGAGFDIGPILAGAGVAGLAIGFGAQNLVRDVISGLFLLVENQIRINDVVVINGTRLVERSICVRRSCAAWTVRYTLPERHHPGLSQHDARVLLLRLRHRVAYKVDTDRVVETMREARPVDRGEKYKALVLEPLEVLGVDRFAESAVIIKARLKTLPMKQWKWAAR